MQSSPTKGTALNAFKAADEIRCRMFDHKQFTGGEIRYFAKEFEEKRDWKEVESLALTANSTRDTIKTSTKCCDILKDESVSKSLSECKLFSL